MAQVPDIDVTTTSVGGSAYTVPFAYQNRAEVFVEVNGTPVAFTWVNDGNISITPAPVAGAAVRRYRSTSALEIRHDYRNGVPFTPKNIAENNDQLLYVVQESVNDTAGTAARALTTAQDALTTAQDALDLVGERTQYMVLGPYGPGLEFQTTSQVFGYLGEFYAPGPSITLPYTTTGVGAAEIANFRAVGDAVLRADLNSPDASKGSSLIKFFRGITGFLARSLSDRLSDTISVKDFGAIGDGIADDTAAFNAAIAYSNSRGAIDFGGVTGTTIKIPDGRYVIGALNPITRSGCEFVGESRNGAVLLCSPGTTTFTFGNGVETVVGGGIRNCKVEYRTTPTPSTFFCTFDLAYRVMLSDILVANIGTLCRLGVSNSRPAGGIVLNNIDGSKANVASGLFQLRFGAGLFLNQVHVFIPVPAPTHPNPMTTMSGCLVFDCSAGFWDTLQVTNCLFERFDQGLSVVAGSGKVYQNLFFTNTIFDYTRRYCVYAESQVGGVISGIRFDPTSWFATWESNAIELTGAGYHDNHNFAGKIVLAGANGIQYSCVGPRNIVFDTMQINSVNRQGTGAAAINIAANATGFSILGCKGNVDTTAIGFPWRAAYGVVIGANADLYVATGNRFEGSTAGWGIAANSVGSTNRLVGDNASANYAAAAAGLTIAASGVPIVNTTPYKIDVLINGGTVTGISRNGVGIPNMIAGALSIDPGQSITIAYSVAPYLSSFARS